jgi:DNA-binding Xre family transcriptional regulator
MRSNELAWVSLQLNIHENRQSKSHTILYIGAIVKSECQPGDILQYVKED